MRRLKCGMKSMGTIEPIRFFPLDTAFRGTTSQDGGSMPPRRVFLLQSAPSK